MGLCGPHPTLSKSINAFNTEFKHIQIYIQVYINVLQKYMTLRLINHIIIITYIYIYTHRYIYIYIYYINIIYIYIYYYIIYIYMFICVCDIIIYNSSQAPDFRPGSGLPAGLRTNGRHRFHGYTRSP